MAKALATFRFDGGEYSFEFIAEDWADAERKLQAIRTTSTLTGFPCHSIPANSVTLPFVHLFVATFAWIRNALR